MTGLEITKVAALAECSPRTVQRHLDGAKTLPAIERAIKAAMKKLGFEAQQQTGESSNG